MSESWSKKVTLPTGDVVTVEMRPGGIARKFTVSYEMSDGRPDHKVCFDSAYEFDYWLYLLTMKEVACVVRNTATLHFREPSTVTTDDGTTHTAYGYKPDFIVIWADGQCDVVEIKGWANARWQAIMQGIDVNYPKLRVSLVDLKLLRGIQRRTDIDGWVKI